MVRRRGLEPLCLAALAPQASASANFATSARSLPHVGCDRSDLKSEVSIASQTLAKCPNISVASLASLPYTEVCPGQDGRLAQLVRAPRLHRGCRGFESLTAHHLLIPQHSKTNHRCDESLTLHWVFVFSLVGFRESLTSGGWWLNAGYSVHDPDVPATGLSVALPTSC